MCFKKKQGRPPTNNEPLPDNQNMVWLKLGGVSLRVPEGSEMDIMFFDLKAALEEKLGMKISNSQALRHAIAIANQHYNQKVGM